MTIMQINYNDLMGSGFTGRDLNEYYRHFGHDAQQCVWCKDGND